MAARIKLHGAFATPEDVRITQRPKLMVHESSARCIRLTSEYLAIEER